MEESLTKNEKIDTQNEIARLTKKLRNTNEELKKLYQVALKEPLKMHEMLDQFHSWCNEGKREVKGSYKNIKFSYSMGLLRGISLVNNICLMIKDLEIKINKEKNIVDEEKIPYISISEYHIIYKSFCFIINWGINPLLMRGVGTLVEKDLKRWRNDKILCKMVLQIFKLDKDDKIDLFQRCVMSEHLHYLLGAMMQICYGPSPKRKNEDDQKDQNFFSNISSPSQLYSISSK